MKTLTAADREALANLTASGALTATTHQHFCTPGCEDGCRIRSERTWRRTEVTEWTAEEFAERGRIAAEFWRETLDRLGEGPRG